MADTIEFIDDRYIKNEFANIKPHRYDENSRMITIENTEYWEITRGTAEIKKGLYGKGLFVTDGDILKLSKGDSIIFTNISDYLLIKQTLVDKDKADEIKVNIVVNYAIIRRILRIFNIYELFNSNPIDTKPIFAGAEDGDIFKHYDTYNDVADLIKYMSLSSGIPEEIWFGKRRLKTGLKYVKEGFEGDLLLDSCGSEILEQKSFLHQLINDPMGLKSSDNPKIRYVEGMHNLYGLLEILIFSMKEEFSREIKIERREQWVSVNKKGLPINVRYGVNLKSIIKKLGNYSSI